MARWPRPSLAEMRERWARAQQGPWIWKGTTSSKSIDLMSTASAWGDVVMGFERWGFKAAQPTFNIGGLLWKAAGEVNKPSMFVAPQAHHPWDVRAIDHPDAIAIAASPHDMSTALGIIDILAEQLAQTRARAEWACALLDDESEGMYTWADPDIASLLPDWIQEQRNHVQIMLSHIHESIDPE